ncbi:endonuclease VII [Gordonia phage Keelan]|nr:endonuclease VII [Gordonia phage Keelan]
MALYGRTTITAKARRCKDCQAAGIETNRPAPKPGPRCVSHWNAKEKARKEREWSRSILAKYGITGEQYYAILEAQGGKCFICQRAIGKRRKLAVDHDHDTMEVRGILCQPCNFIIIGRYDKEALLRALEYLEYPPARRVLK